MATPMLRIGFAAPRGVWGAKPPLKQVKIDGPGPPWRKWLMRHMLYSSRDIHEFSKKVAIIINGTMEFIGCRWNTLEGIGIERIICLKKRRVHGYK